MQGWQDVNFTRPFGSIQQQQLGDNAAIRMSDPLSQACITTGISAETHQEPQACQAFLGTTSRCAKRKNAISAHLATNAER